ncbi:MAG: tRNA isopentenyl-2-thiomethyl-A-37 hydroxylase MiaE [Planctomycetota bacterium]|jgi:tRNA-(ms[2]io[6]A)-hydroxylase
MLGLKSETDPKWAKTALRNETALLNDHAHLERKAAGHAITLIGYLPDAGPELLEVAREELEHYEKVCALLARRGAELTSDSGNPYVRRLARATNNSLLDRVLRMGLIEARSYERFCLLCEEAEGEIGELFRSLKESEAGHHALFLKLAYDRWPREEVQARWEVLSAAEAEIMASIKWGSRVH